MIMPTSGTFSKFLLCLFLVLFISCNKEEQDDTFSNPNGFLNSEKIMGLIEGRVLDEEEKPMAFVKVIFDNQLLETNLQGYFKIEGLISNGLSFIKFSKDGYFNSYATLTPSKSGEVFFDIILKKSKKVYLQDNRISTNDWSIELEPQSVVSETGEPYDGVSLKLSNKN